MIYCIIYDNKVVNRLSVGRNAQATATEAQVNGESNSGSRMVARSGVGAGPSACRERCHCRVGGSPIRGRVF